MPFNPRSSRILGPISAAILLSITIWSAHSTIRAINADKLKDFAEFLAGARALDMGTDLYSAGSLGYIYPPLLAWLLIPLSRLADHHAALLWMALNLSLLLFTALLASRDVLRRVIGSTLPTFSPTALLVASAGLILIADKTRADIVMGQCNLLIAALWLLVLIFMERRPTLAGLILGFTANIKYITLIAVPYFIIRRNYKAAAFSLLFTILWALLPATTLGIDTNNRYLAKAFGGLTRMVSQESEIIDARPREVERDPASIAPTTPGQSTARIAGLADIRSISIPSAISRFTGKPLTDPFTLSLITLSAGAFILTALLLYRAARIPLFTLPWNPPHPTHSSPLLIATEFSGLLATVLCFGPQTNPRHLVLLLPMFVLIAALLLVRRGTALPGGVLSPSSFSSDPSAKCPALSAVEGPVLSPERSQGPSASLLLFCSLALFLALILPPGGERFESAVNWWRSVGGISWALALCYLALLDFSLREIQAQPPDQQGD